MIEKEVEEAIANKDKPAMIKLANTLLDRIEKGLKYIFDKGGYETSKWKEEYMITTLRSAATLLYNGDTVMGSKVQLETLKCLLFGIHDLPIVEYDMGYNAELEMYTLTAGERITTDDVEPFNPNTIPDRELGFTLYIK